MDYTEGLLCFQLMKCSLNDRYKFIDEGQAGSESRCC